MRKKIFLSIIWLSTCFLATAQSLFIEYNIGYADNTMSSPRHFLEQSHPTVPLEHLKVTDNFPGYLTHEGKIGLEWNRLHQAGISMNYLNTAGSKNVSDYSGSYHVDCRVKGFRLGAFYRYHLPALAEKRFSPYLQLSAGTIFNHGKLAERFTLSGQQGEHSTLSLKVNSFFAEPAVGCRIRLLPRVALNLSAGYEWDFSTPAYKSGGDKTTLIPDWNGWRVSGGVAYSLPLH